MTIAPSLADSRIMVGRCLRRSRRDPEAFFTALILPIALMLLFVYVFGGALKTGVSYVDYVVPGLIVLCAGFGAGTTAVSVATDMTNGIIDRFRSMPVSAASVLVGHVVASMLRNLIATTAVIGVALGIGWRPHASPLALGRGRRPGRPVCVGDLVVRSCVRSSRRQCGSRQFGDIRTDVHPLCEHGVRARVDHASGPASVRRAPAVHACDRNHAGTVDG